MGEGVVDMERFGSCCTILRFFGCTEFLFFGVELSGIFLVMGSVWVYIDRLVFGVGEGVGEFDSDLDGRMWV